MSNEGENLRNAGLDLPVRRNEARSRRRHWWVVTWFGLAGLGLVFAASNEWGADPTGIAGAANAAAGWLADIRVGTDEEPAARFYIQTGIAVLTGLAVAAAAYFTLRRAQAAEYGALVEERSSMTDRYAAAVRMLVDEEVIVRKAGLAGLESLVVLRPDDWSSPVHLAILSFIEHRVGSFDSAPRDADAKSRARACRSEVRLAFDTLYRQRDALNSSNLVQALDPRHEARYNEDWGPVVGLNLTNFPGMGFELRKFAFYDCFTLDGIYDGEPFEAPAGNRSSYIGT